MTEEDAFLAGIRAHPSDDLRRLVYADWLEERGTAEARAKAEYLRLEVHIAALAEGCLERDGHILRLKKLARWLTSYWKASVSKLPIERCAARWEFLCPKKWDELSATPDVFIRSCDTCDKYVHYCTTLGEAYVLVDERWLRVVFDRQVRRQPGDLPPVILGRIEGWDEISETDATG